MNLREAAEMALEALEMTKVVFEAEEKDYALSRVNSAAKALRQALAQPEQEQPKHWSDCAIYNEPAYPNGECDCGGFDPNNKWHGLTEEEAEKIAFDVIVDGVSKRVRKAMTQPEDTKCKDNPDAPHSFNRNASLTEDRYVCDCEYWEPPVNPVNMSQALAQSEQEPVACIGTNGELMWLKKPSAVYSHAQPLYTSPPKREWVGLTEDEFEKVLEQNNEAFPFAVYQQLEAKLKEKNG